MAAKLGVTFLIDMGMTATAGECLINLPIGKRGPAKRYQFDKTPTQLVYGETGEVMAWGHDCGKQVNIKKKFKAHFRDKSTADASEEFIKWTCDYLRCFGSFMLDEVLQKEGLVREQIDGEWHLTTPGCWSDPVRRNFEETAREGLGPLLLGGKVIANTSESLTSCEFLVNTLHLPDQTWVVTCDIGGSTCDTALAIMQTSDGLHVPLVFPVDTEGAVVANVQTIDRELGDQLVKHLTSLSVPTRQHLAKTLVSSAEWKQIRHAFDASGDVVLTADTNHGEWNCPSSGISVNGFEITIPCQMMENMFKKFLDNLWLEIDGALRHLHEKTPRKKVPAAIALCGGGGTMAYPLKKLKLRYSELEIKSHSSPEESRLATIIGHRMYMERRVMDNYLAGIDLGISIPSAKSESAQSIDWATCSTPTTVFKLSSNKEKTDHYLIIYTKACPRPRPASLNILLKDPWGWKQWDGILVFPLQVTLDRHLFRKQKYRIKVSCTERGVFSFAAWDEEDPSARLQLTSETYPPEE